MSHGCAQRESRGWLFIRLSDIVGLCAVGTEPDPPIMPRQVFG